jgi:hypothetical protein
LQQSNNALCVAAFVLLSLVVPRVSEAQQQSEKLPRIGVLNPAKSLGLTVAPSIMLQASEVIQ